MNGIRRTAAVAALCLALAACTKSSTGPQFPGNAAPTAQAGFDRTVGKNALVTLDGSASFDPEAHPLTYLWTIVSRPAGSTATVANPIAAVTYFTADVVGAYVVRLQVSDGVQSAQDDATITSQNQAPVALAGPDRQGSKGVALALSGTASYDPDQDPLSWQWTLVSAPPASAAALTSETAATATLVPDVFGQYVVRLTVSDAALSAQDDLTITVQNHAPVANAGPDRESNVGATLSLSGAASTDPDQDPLTCAWTLVTRPPSSATALSDPSSCAPAVAFDVEGTYAFSLVVSDGTLQSVPDALQVTVHRRVWMLGHAVADAEYSRALDRIVTVGGSPNRLYLADPVSGAEQSVDLSLTPTSVSVSPDGLHAAVGHNGFVSYVRLSPAPLLVDRVLATTADVLDVVLAGNGWVYAFPRIDQWEAIRCIRISTGVETLSTGMTIYAGTKAKLHPSGTKIYGADNGLSPSDIERYDISGGTAAYAYDSPYHGDYPMCGDLWISEDGLRIFTACGRTFHANDTQGTVAGSDMTYAGALDSTTLVRWVDHSLAAGLVMAVPAAAPYAYPPQPNADAEVRIFGADFLGLQQTIALPRIGVGGTGYVSRGRFAFFSQDGTSRFVIAQVDASAGLLAPDAVVAY